MTCGVNHSEYNLNNIQNVSPFHSLTLNSCSETYHNEPIVEEEEQEKKKKHKQTDVDMDLDPFISNKPTTSRNPYVDLKLSGRQIEANKIMVPNHTSAYGTPYAEE